MSKLILSVDNDELNLFKRQYLSLPELSDEIEKMLEQKVDKRKKKVYAKWKEDINFLIDMYNSRAKFKTYNRVK
jgi:hypothetical protein